MGARGATSAPAAFAAPALAASLDAGRRARATESASGCKIRARLGRALVGKVATAGGDTFAVRSSEAVVWVVYVAAGSVAKVLARENDAVAAAALAGGRSAAPATDGSGRQRATAWHFGVVM